MIINKIVPQGYCGGVKNALDIVYKLLADVSTIKPIYLLGSIIHNKHVIKDLTDKGVILIEEKGKTRYELLDRIEAGTVVFSAHGVEPRVYEKAKLKGLNIIDTTCGNVLIVHQRIKEYLQKNYKILYIGTLNHPECEGVLGIDSSITLISNVDDLDNISTDKRLYVTNQTTLSMFQTKEIYEEIKKKFPNAIIDNKICNATTIRQKAMLNQKPVDLCLVVGDINSSNTKKLSEASQSVGINTILVDNLIDVKNIDFTNINSISISSGASTPNYIVDEIINYLTSI